MRQSKVNLSATALKATASEKKSRCDTGPNSSTHKRASRRGKGPWSPLRKTHRKDLSSRLSHRSHHSRRAHCRASCRTPLYGSSKLRAVNLTSLKRQQRSLILRSLLTTLVSLWPRSASWPSRLVL